MLNYLPRIACNPGFNIKAPLLQQWGFNLMGGWDESDVYFY